MIPSVARDLMCVGAANGQLSAATVFATGLNNPAATWAGRQPVASPKANTEAMSTVDYISCVRFLSCWPGHRWFHGTHED
jgi:hypothetical protein